MRLALTILIICLLASCTYTPMYKEDKLDSEMQEAKLRQLRMLDSNTYADTSEVDDLFNKCGTETDPINLEIYNRKFDSISKIDFARYKWFEKGNGLVSDAKMASEIAYIYLKRIYGDRIFRLYVYSVGEYWYVTNIYGEIGIKKSNGQILGMMHDKD